MASHYQDLWRKAISRIDIASEAETPTYNLEPDGPVRLLDAPPRDDADLEDALFQCRIGCITYEDVIGIAALVPGEADGPRWHWICLLRDGSVVLVTAWCDYSGWGCQNVCYVTYTGQWEIVWDAHRGGYIDGRLAAAWELVGAAHDPERPDVGKQLCRQLDGEQPYGTYMT